MRSTSITIRSPNSNSSFRLYWTLPNCTTLYTMAPQYSTPHRLGLSTKELMRLLLQQNVWAANLWFISITHRPLSVWGVYVHYGTGSNINTLISLSWRVGARQEHFSDQNDVDCLVELLCAWAWAPLGSDDCCWCQLLGCLYTKSVCHMEEYFLFRRNIDKRELYQFNGLCWNAVTLHIVFILPVRTQHVKQMQEKGRCTELNLTWVTSMLLLSWTNHQHEQSFIYTGHGQPCIQAAWEKDGLVSIACACVAAIFP